MAATTKYQTICGCCGIDRAVFDAQTKALAETRAELEHARNDLARTIDTSNSWCDKYAAKNSELAAMTKRKDGWRRVAKAYRSNVFVTNSELREWSLLRRIERREARNGHTD